MSCLCLGEGKKGGTGKTHVIKHDKKFWRIKTKGEGKDYQEDDVKRERLYSYLISFFNFFLSLFCKGALEEGEGEWGWSNLFRCVIHVTQGQNVRL